MDNPSYYINGHRIAEAPEGYYCLVGNYLHYVDKNTLSAVLLSEQAFTLEELQANQQRRANSDAYFLLASSVFYYKDHVYVLELGDMNSNTWVLCQLDLNGGRRKKLTTFHSENGWATLLNGVIYASSTKYDQENQIQRYMESYSLESGKVGEAIPLPIHSGGFKHKDAQLITFVPYRGRLYLTLMLKNEDSLAMELLIIDPESNSQFVQKTITDSKNKDAWVCQSITFYQDNILYNMIPLAKASVSQDKNELTILQSDLAGENLNPFAKLPFTLNLISNGEKLFSVPAHAAFGSRGTAGDGAHFDAYRASALDISTFTQQESKKILSFPEEKVDALFRMCMISSNGTVLVSEANGLQLDQVSEKGLIEIIDFTYKDTQ